MQHTGGVTDVVPRSSRPLNAAWLGGVCAGLADHLRWSPLVLRVLFVVLAATGLVGVALYLVLWLVMPRSTAQAQAPGIEAATRTGMRQAAAGLRPVDYSVAGGRAIIRSSPGDGTEVRLETRVRRAGSAQARFPEPIEGSDERSE